MRSSPAWTNSLADAEAGRCYRRAVSSTPVLFERRFDVIKDSFHLSGRFTANHCQSWDGSSIRWFFGHNYIEHGVIVLRRRPVCIPTPSCFFILVDEELAVHVLRRPVAFEGGEGGALVVGVLVNASRPMAPNRPQNCVSRSHTGSDFQHNVRSADHESDAFPQ